QAVEKPSCLVGDEVTSLKFPRFSAEKLETRYLVSYFFNRLLGLALVQRPLNSRLIT
ncbi:MAG: hypothetical protein JWM68_911, partial [Verrucomicrobiales bacterium]|nr:hypothetical protein [Verrucomicrobiales bacterium]